MQGTVAPGFEPVRAAFIENFKSRGEWGASVCISHEGRIVVDLWGGLANQIRKPPWEADTLATVFSCTKGMVALCMMMLADRGRLDYDAPVAEYWPAFAQGGKSRITVRTLLNHRSGLVGVDAPITLDMLESRPEEVSSVLEGQKPHWEPGTDQGYHAVTYGLYAGELFRRLTEESLGAFFAREVAGPLGADVYIGLPREKEHRVATNYPVTTAERLFKIVPKLLFHPGNEGRVYRQIALGGDAAKAFANPKELGPLGIHHFNSRRVHQMVLPWASGIASARGLCRVYTALANGGAIDGVTLVRPEAIAPVHARQSWVTRDRVLRKPLGFSQGFLKEETRLFSPSTESFGHAGAGGSLGFCDPKARLAIGYVKNKMDHHVRSPAAIAICHAAYGCLKTQRGG